MWHSSWCPQGAGTWLRKAIPSSNDEPALLAVLSRSLLLSFPSHLLFINSCLAVLLISPAWNNVTFPSTLLFYFLSSPPPAAAFLPPPPAWKAIIHFFISSRLYFSDNINNLLLTHGKKKIRKLNTVKPT